MSGMLEDQLDLVLTTQRQRRRQHKAEQAECPRTIHEAKSRPRTHAGKVLH